MFSRMAGWWIFCFLIATAGISCYRSTPLPATGQVSKRGTEPADTAPNTTRSANDSATASFPAPSAETEMPDADEVLNSALALARQDNKRLLVHLGAPG